ncbi:AAA family ATPase [Corynebacterium camporealensis]
MALVKDSKSNPSNGDYLVRYIDKEIDALEGASALAIDGAKGVGKSETSLQRVDKSFYLDREVDREYVRSRFDLLLKENKWLLFDEWQHLPEVWDSVRRLVDERTERVKLFVCGVSL